MLEVLLALSLQLMPLGETPAKVILEDGGPFGESPIGQYSCVFQQCSCANPPEWCPPREVVPLAEQCVNFCASQCETCGVKTCTGAVMPNGELLCEAQCMTWLWPPACW